ncbi:hypothetical protein DERF_000040 [Dermatophagoides farinae]|uniref:Uncharacterized protein n=1 Tax=Dermatophagoides farinae TaxID=6954 RepID=A0A922L895_DERFA|nr:hypothetical protein DERF_000040 [Dermatophagoides farinae]
MPKDKPDFFLVRIVAYQYRLLEMNDFVYYGHSYSLSSSSSSSSSLKMAIHSFNTPIHTIIFIHGHKSTTFNWAFV